MFQHVEICGRDGAYDLQACDVGVVALQSVQVFRPDVPSRRYIRFKSQCRCQRVRRSDGDGLDGAIATDALVGVDVVGILCPLLAVELAEFLRHEDAEVVWQGLEGMLSQLGHRVCRNVDGVEADAVAKGIAVDAPDGAWQRDGLHLCALEEGILSQFTDVAEPVEVFKPLDRMIALEDAVDALQL